MKLVDFNQTVIGGRAVPIDGGMLLEACNLSAAAEEVEPSLCVCDFGNTSAVSG